jgi:predicted DNA-binding ribbon-helix-helix protein
MSAAAILRSLLQDARAAKANAGPGLVSRNITVRGHRTSIRLEASLWNALKEICQREGLAINELCTFVATVKNPALSLTAALRVAIANYFRHAATEEGHARAGHARRTLPLHAALGRSRQKSSAAGLAVTPAE